LKISEKVLGEEHPDTLVSYYNIGTFYFECKSCLKAKEYLDICVERMDKVEYIPFSKVETRKIYKAINGAIKKNRNGKICKDIK
jgi:hypothetical protein